MQFRFCTRVAAGVVAASTFAVLSGAIAPAGAATHVPAQLGTVQLAGTTKIGPVSGLAMSFTKPGPAYRVHVAWNALATASSYRVSLVNAAGTTLASAKVTAHDWTTDQNLAVSSRVTAKVVPYAGKRPGRQATTSAVVPDVTPPTGTYALTLAGRTATYTQTSLSDDGTAQANIKREIDWGLGLGYVPVTSDADLTHTYDPGKKAYHPVMRLTDAAGNVAVLELTAVAIDDTEKPTGSFADTVPTKVWAKLTPVVVTQTADLWDDVSAPADITRTVNWQDGTTTQWTAGTTLKHVYTKAGSFTPTVTLKDEFGRTNDYSVDPVTVVADTVSPKVSLTRPVHRRWVSAWARLRGKASDTAGTGVRNVSVRVIEQRGTTWYAYRATTRTWVKASTKSAALTKSRVATVTPVRGAWTYRLPGLRKGVLLVKVKGRDVVGNVSIPVTYKQRLTHR